MLLVDGGGIYCEDSSPTIIGCIIIDNTANSDGGGGMYFSSSDPIITNCTIADNTADFGGGIACEDSSSPKIENCTITGNTADFGGGIYCPSSSPTITNCTITYNEAIDSGGGINCSSASTSTIKSCTITGNTATGAGGGIHCYSSSPTISNCVISSNGAGTRGGGIACRSGSSPKIENCIISSNTANKGGGIARRGGASSPTITNCTIADNEAGDSGGGIHCQGSGSLTVTNCILYFDSPEEIGLIDSDDPDVTHSDVQGGWPGEGNIDCDPQFVDDYHLGNCSCCIGAGIMTEDVPLYDFEGDPRPNPDGSNPDIGADENPLGEPNTGVIKGHVTDALTVEPIQWAFVIAINADTKERYSDFTDENGYYEIPVPPATYWVICIKKGYKAVIRRVEVPCGETIIVDFELIPKPD
ncbi:right-handed parallel beta-helix repeat-containing protein [bacterium]|nr:right-handed parallel beta-helix repeat-containing protein [bacterium]